MSRRAPSPTSRPVAIALLAVVAGASADRARAQASTPVCLNGRVQVEAPLPSGFDAALAETCTRLENASDVDPDISLTLRVEGARVVVVASLPDGRTALRHVGQPDRLLETMEALAVLPVHAGPAATQLVAPPPPDEAPRAAPVVLPAQNLRLELGGTFGGRALGTPAYAGVTLEGYAALRLRAWSLALTMRWDPLVRALGDDYSRFEMSTLGVGFAFTRRWEPSALAAFDFGGAAGVDVQIEEYRLGSVETTRTGTGARVGLLARSFVGRGRVRFLSTLEVDVSPSLALHPLRVDTGLPRLPYVSVGVAAGIAWSPG